VNAPRDVQEIEMGRLLHRRQTCHDQPGAEQWDVEALSVERDEHRGLIHALPNALEHGRLFTQLANEKLLQNERSIRVPPRKAHQEGDGACASREPRRFGVEKKGAPKRAFSDGWIESQERKELGARVERGP
jgi:hypothetical protein